MTAPAVLYELVFDAALTMNRAAKDTKDELGLAMSQTLFKICNCWSKDSGHFPVGVLESAAEVAIAWEKATTNEVPEEQGNGPVAEKLAPGFSG